MNDCIFVVFYIREIVTIIQSWAINQVKWFRNFRIGQN
jgi:hypothetical protein